MSLSGFDLSDEQQKLVAALLREQGIALDDSAGPMLRVDLERRNEPFPLTDVQEAYFLGRSGHFELGNVACHGYQEFDVEGLDVERYEEAWNRAVARHDMLRAVVSPGGTQTILREVPRFRVDVTDLRRKAPEEREQALREVRDAMSHRVPDPHRWPMFAVRVSRLDDGRARIHISSDALLLDGHSAALLQGEIRRFYEDPGFAPPPLAVSFRDYVLTLRAQQDAEAWRESERYWRIRAETLPPAPELPLCVRVSDVERPRFVRRQRRLEPAVWSRLKDRSRALGATSSVLVLAAFAEVLRRFGRRRDFTVNLTLFDRQPVHPEVDRIAGDFTSTLLVEVRDDGATFAERVRALQESFLRDLEHRRVSGMHALRHYAHVHRRVGAALMPVVFTSMLATGPAGRDVAPAGHLGELTYTVTQTPQVLLDHQLHEDRGALVLAWDTVEEAFAPGVLDAMFAAYLGLLERLGEEGSPAWQEASPVGLPAEQAGLRRRQNATAAPESGDLLHSAFCRNAQAHPEREAIVCEDRRLSYGELAERAVWLAARLRAHGVAPGELVAVVMERGWEQAVAVLAVLEAGGAYVPIDATLPEKRIHALLDATRTRVVLAQSWVKERLALHGHGAIETVDDAGRCAPTWDAPRQRPEDVAYVIYTSGSTGTPKGVVIEHRSAVNTVEDINARFDVGPSDRVLGVSSLSFDLSVYDIFGTLAAGGCLVMPGRGHDKDPEHWLTLVQRERVSLWNSVPALLQMLVDFAEGRGASLARLRVALLSGDWIPVDLPERLRKLAPGVRAVSLGGATEASIWSIVHPIEGALPGWTSVPYGRPLRNQRWYVLNDRMEECPDHVSGELYIGGLGLARGYWDDPTRTAERFVTWAGTGERLYRTGDLGRYREGGVLEILGREDQQVKVGGHRIELGEIEAALGDHPSVREAVVIAQGEAQDSQKPLVGYAVLRPGAQASEDVLLQHLRERLPLYMIPRYLRLLEALPLSANGKVDRRALPKVDVSDRRGEHIAPRTDLERTLAGVVAEVLRLPQVSVKARFLDLGATSLALVEVHKILEARLGREIPVLDLFEHGSVAALAARLETACRDIGPQAVEGTARAAQDPVSLARLQGARRRQQRSRGRAAETDNESEEQR
ncbi:MULTISPECIES: non-ribosomal peptide synthetase [Sorangium]|uniref:Peptide synthetase n=1 Tax=Sorangium cellulosum TaxID=56 RepID=A0A4P2QRB9_SORCE|nr:MULTISPECIES: non-ribosomal peptide synthetase [Sorangium]AUX32750.1 peptide synthetase [Sorangium cellulosum]WCQ92126.1 Phenyloxazoline synthase MbtB [Sorangium sp. Soce836]